MAAILNLLFGVIF